MSDLLDLLEIPDAAVPLDASVADAARVLYGVGVGAVAVLEGTHVRGMVTEEDLMAALFPRYLREVTHTAFVESDDNLFENVGTAGTRAIADVMRAAEVVALPTSALDVAQRFLHSESAGLVATRDGAFVGIIDQARFTKAILTRRYGWEL